MTARNVANVTLGVALGFVLFGAFGCTSHDQSLIVTGIVGVLLAGVWRLRL